MAEDHLDKAQSFLDSLQRLGAQLKAAEDRQRFYLAEMLQLKQADKTDSDEYNELNSKSQSLQALIDKFRPIYLERLEMAKNAQVAVRKRRMKRNWMLQKAEAKATKSGSEDCRESNWRLQKMQVKIASSRTYYKRDNT